MAKNYDGLLDEGFNAMKAGCIRVAACSGEPANFAGIAAVTLATATVASTDFTGPADGTTSGRKLTFAGKSAITPSANGTVTHMVYHNNVDKMYAVTTTTSQAVTTAQSWNFPSNIIEIADPT